MIRARPEISQNEIARQLGITRSSAAVHIASLTKKGYLRGRGYLVAKNDYVCGVGAANVDVSGRSKKSLILRDSNPGHMSTACGGVTRNILENLARLGQKTALLTAVGDDVYGNKILADSAEAGIDTAHVLTVAGETSSSYISVLDHGGDMYIALSDMTILRHITPEFLHAKSQLIAGAQAVVCDPSLPPDVMENLLTGPAKDRPVFVDPVSTSYAKTIIDFIGRYHTIAPNEMELEVLAGMKITNDKQLEQACDKLLAKGCESVVVTRGAKGCFYADRAGNRVSRALRPVADMVNASGAGDSFTAGMVYGFIRSTPIDKMLDFALAAGIIAVHSERTINPEISVPLVQKTIQKHKLK